jgi:hypothetical protein
LVTVTRAVLFAILEPEPHFPPQKVAFLTKEAVQDKPELEDFR